MGKIRACAVAVMVFLPWVTTAQVTQPLTGRDMQSLRTAPAAPIADPALPAPTEEEKTLLTACDTLYLTRPAAEFPADLGGAPNGYMLIGECATDLAKKIKGLNEPDATAHNRALIRFRVNYKTLLRWVDRGRDNRAGSSRETAQSMVRALDETLGDALKARNLFAQFSATLMTGPSFADTKKDDKGEDKTKILALGVVTWESRHFGDVSLEPIDLSFGGRLGVEPVLTVVAPDTTVESGEPTLTGTQQSAFVWSFDVNAHRQHRAINSEYGWFARTGAAMLTTVPSLVDRDRGSFVALPADNGTGKTAWFWESGLQFTMFDNRLAQVHAEGGTTTPQFQLGVAWRHDRRFARAGALADYNRPEHRLVFRMTIDALQVLDKRAFGQKGKTFSLGFSVEHERDFFSSGRTVPSATRYMLRGDLDLMKGFTSTDLPKSETAKP